MRNGLQKSFLVLLALATMSISVLGQGSSGSLSGSVVDPKGAVVAGATVVVKSIATNQENTTQTSNDGAFNVPTLASGMYTATITATGFKQAVVTDIKIDVGKPSSIQVELEVGTASETVTVVGGGELLQTQSATVGTTLTGRQITDLPTASRDALDLVLAMPGTTTVGRPRQSSVNGLPKGALNITLDGINVQDNLLKSSDGFFTYVRPRTDAISEVTVSTATPGAESSAEGAVQIKFVTQGGSNDYHGGFYWYHRNPALNANYWFNNRNLPPDPVTGKAPQARILLNQPGGKFGGPIRFPKLFDGRDKAFFFVNYEEYRLPETTSRTRNILSPQAQSGIFRFFNASDVSAANTTCVAAPAGSPAARLCSVDVFARAAAAADCNHQLAGNQPCLSTADPTIGALLSDIRSSVGGFNIRNTGDPNIQQVSFVNPGGQVRKFPTVRLDFNITKNHHLENVWNYQQFRSSVDFLNSVDPTFPGFPNFGSQDSNRFSNSTAWRWTVSQNIVNEMRYGVIGGTSLFFAQVNAGQFENQGGFNLGLGNFASGGFTLTGATATNAPSRRHTPVRQFNNNLSWVTGNHSTSFGGSFTKITWWNQSLTAVPSAVFSTSQTLDPNGFAVFTGLGNAQAGAAQLYYLLSGRMTALNANARLNEDTLKYSYLGDLESRAGQKEYGIYGQDSWRVRPDLTVNFGLRWEVQLPFTGLNDTFATVPFAGLFGVSGEGNLFKPGTLTGGASTYALFGKGYQAYSAQYGNFAPTVGIAWSPNFENGFLRKLGGNAGQTVLRAGYSVAYNREGVGVFSSVTGSNPGGTLTANRNLTLGNLPVNTYLRQGPFAPPSFPAEPVYPNTGLITDSVNAFHPDLKIGKIHSWTVSFQRELNSNTVLELRYIGNRGKDLWRQFDLNELNIIENGVFAEWQIAQRNLLANIAANRCQTGLSPVRGDAGFTAGCQANFAYFGPGTGTSPLPITLGYFQGLSGAAVNNPANYTNANFRSSTYYNTMNPLNPAPLTFGSNLSSTSFDNRRNGILFPANHFLVNPGKRGGAFLVDNSGESFYDAATIELRRRLSNGLLVQANYTFGKAIANTYASSSAVFDQPNTLRDPDLERGLAPFDITHSLKANFIYELPVGQGKKFFSGARGIVNGFLGGWGFNGNIRMQSGNPFSLGNVQLVGMSKKDLQDAVGVYRDPDGFIYVFPKEIRDNTVKAHNLAVQIFTPTASQVGVMSTATITYTQGAPTGAFIAPAGFGNCQQSFGFTPGASANIVGGGCGFANLVLKGPAFFRSDLSLVKKVRFSETMNLELRGEFLNAFNNINFLVGSAGNDLNTLGGFTSSAFGRMTNAYQDLSTTNDPGGRLVQLVVRFNF
ncbi:MAG TPA: TonB-dependent receptor [Pyrinomonadaceae bacterium]|nr:TonB-dependent receptor [Pyrinomonadaceae bacterium]